MKKTAIEWLTNELKSLGIYSSTLKEKCELAKEMEKEQIIDAYINGIHSECYKNGIGIGCGKHYYNQTYKQD